MPVMLFFTRISLASFDMYSSVQSGARFINLTMVDWNFHAFIHPSGLADPNVFKTIFHHFEERNLVFNTTLFTSCDGTLRRAQLLSSSQFIIFYSLLGNQRLIQSCFKERHCRISKVMQYHEIDSISRLKACYSIYPSLQGVHGFLVTHNTHFVSRIENLLVHALWIRIAGVQVLTNTLSICTSSLNTFHLSNFCWHVLSSTHPISKA